jgi:hypothetical protein
VPKTCAAWPDASLTAGCSASRREEWWKDAEILVLRHQLAVALRERPRAL